MACTTAFAQTIKVVDKNGKTTSYDASKLDSVSFQNTGDYIMQALEFYGKYKNKIQNKNRNVR